MKKLECFKVKPFFFREKWGWGKGFPNRAIIFSFNMMGLLTCALFFV